MKSPEEKLKDIASDEISNWAQKAQWRVENESWLDKSARIALVLLRVLRAKDLSQKDLAVKLNVSAQQISKILKGSENLTLETISKLEIVLGITLMEIPSIQTNIKVNTDIDWDQLNKMKKINLLTQQNTFELTKPIEIFEQADSLRNRAV